MISSNDAGKHSQKTAGNPPANGVANKVDLLTCVILSPEAHSAKQEGPVVRLAGVRVAAGQLVVVVEHGPLQLEPLAEERQCLHLSLFLFAAGVILRKRGNVLGNPHIRADCDLLVAIDFLLFVAPFRKRSGVCPHGNFAGEVDKLEMAGNSFELLADLGRLNSNLEKSVVLAFAKGFLRRHGGEFLVGGIIRRSDIVREQNLVRDNVPESNQVHVPDNPLRVLHIVRRKDLPVVVCIVVRIASDLLALAGDTAVIISQGVGIGVAVKVCLGLLVSDGDVIIVVNVDSICQHDVVAQGFLEFWRHEVVARTGSSQDGKVHLEPEKIEKEWQNDEANGAGHEVLSKQLQADGTVASLNVQKIPEINDNCRANGNESEETNVFGRDVARQRKASQDEPLPPLPAEGLMSQLVELDVAQETAGHGENQSGIEENQARLANVCIVQENQAGGDKASRQAIA